MSYNVKGLISGFEEVNNVSLHTVDELFSTLKDTENEHISFTVVNPYLLREYSFDVPSDIKVLLEITENSNLSVYNIVVIQQPLEKSTVNFLAPIIINNDNNRIAQVVLNAKRHPDFGMAEAIENFNK